MMRRNGTIQRSCACGEVIVAESDRSYDIAFAVWKHNRGLAHTAWRGEQ